MSDRIAVRGWKGITEEIEELIVYEETSTDDSDTETTPC